MSTNAARVGPPRRVEHVEGAGRDDLDPDRCQVARNAPAGGPREGPHLLSCDQGAQRPLVHGGCVVYESGIRAIMPGPWAVGLPTRHRRSVASRRRQRAPARRAEPRVWLCAAGSCCSARSPTQTAWTAHSSWTISWPSSRTRIMRDPWSPSPPAFRVGGIPASRPSAGRAHLRDQPCPPRARRPRLSRGKHRHPPAVRAGAVRRDPARPTFRRLRVRVRLVVDSSPAEQRSGELHQPADRIDDGAVLPGDHLRQRAGARRRRVRSRGYAVAIAASALGTLAKQSMLTIPLAVLLVDYALFYDSLQVGHSPPLALLPRR